MTFPPFFLSKKVCDPLSVVEVDQIGMSPRFPGLWQADSSNAGMRETVPLLKFKESEALRKQILKEKGTSTVPLHENEKTTNFCCCIYDTVHPRKSPSMVISY